MWITASREEGTGAYLAAVSSCSRGGPVHLTETGDEQ